MHIPLRDPADLNELDRRITAERAALQRDRDRAVRLALELLQTMDIAQRLGRSRDFVQTWAYACRDGGIDAIRAGKATGRPPKLPMPQQWAFILTPPVNTSSMNEHLRPISEQVGQHRHVVLVLDQAFLARGQGVEGAGPSHAAASAAVQPGTQCHRPGVGRPQEPPPEQSRVRGRG